VLAQLQTLTHRAAVRHVLCSEHGEMVEAPELAAQSLDDKSRFVAVTLGVDDDDDHCALATGLRSYQATDHASHSIALVDHVAVTPPVLAGVSCSLDYRIAPKTSPPLRTLTA
jgi:hypothetical protein